MGARERKKLQRDADLHQKIKQLKPRTTNQADYLDSLQNSDQMVVLGPPGTGKTYMAAAHAADLMASRRISRIVLTRPAVAVDSEDLGFLPGDLDEKYEQWAVPLTEVIKERMGPVPFQKAVGDNKIEAIPLGYMDGRTFDNAFVIFDEAQNASYNQLKVFLTRIGMDSKVVINGDINKEYSNGTALETVIDLIETQDLPVDLIEFGIEDVVRSPATAMWVEAFQNYEKNLGSYQG